MPNRKSRNRPKQVLRNHPSLCCMGRLLFSHDQKLVQLHPVRCSHAHRGPHRDVPGNVAPHALFGQRDGRWSVLLGITPGRHSSWSDHRRLWPQ